MYMVIPFYAMKYIVLDLMNEQLLKNLVLTLVLSVSSHGHLQYLYWHLVLRTLALMLL